MNTSSTTETDLPVSSSLEELKRLRGTIDNIDAALIYMLAERFRCTKEVGLLKARTNLPPTDPAREERQISRLRLLASEARLDPDFAEKFLGFIIREVIRHHEAIATTVHSLENPDSHHELCENPAENPK